MKPFQKIYHAGYRPTIAWLVTLFINGCVASTCQAQGDFAAPPRHLAPEAGTSAVTTPASPTSFPPSTFTPPTSGAEPTWPAAPVEFDQYVQQANFKDEAAKQGQGVAQLIGSTMGSASEMLGSIRAKVSEQTGQLLGTSDPSAASETNNGWLGLLKQKAGSPDIPRMIGSLGLVIGGYLALVVVMRKFGGGGTKAIPAEVVDLVGHLPYGPKQQLQLVRLGSKLLLLINGPDGTHPIGEITDPNEVEHLIAQCRTGRRSRAIRPTVGSAALKRQRQPAAHGETVPSASPQLQNAQPVTAESLSDILRRLERATNGHTTSFEA